MFLALLWLAAAPSPGNHQESWRAIHAIRQQAVRDAVAKFDAWLDEHPDDAAAAVERCKLIRRAKTVRDGEADATLGDCLSELEEKYRFDSEAILYRLEEEPDHQESEKLGREALADKNVHWSGNDRAAVYAELSRRGQPSAAAAADARKAMELDPSIDLTRQIARQLFADGRRSEGVAVLSSRPEGGAPSVLTKVGLLVEQKAFARALWLFDTVKERSELSAMTHAQMLAGAGRLADAAKLYDAYGRQRSGVLERLLPIYISLKDEAAALQAYQDLRDRGWKSDPFALRRLSLARVFPHAHWRARDVRGLLLLLLFLLGVGLLPGLSLLSLHYWSLWRRLRGPPLLDAPPGQRWGFRHVWLGCGLAAIFQVIFFIPLDQSLESWTGAVPADDAGVAFSGAFSGYVLAVAATTALLLAFRTDRFRLLSLGTWRPGKAAAQIALTLAISYAVAFTSFRLIPAAGVLSIEQLIGAFLQAHGFWVTVFSVAVVIPLFEELLFRSLLLELYTRWVGFFWANLLQASAFAALHGDPRRLPFYFILGLLLGRLKRNSSGLLPGVIVHALNNAVVVFALNAVGQVNLTPPKPPARFAPSEELLACASSEAAKHRLEELRAKTNAVALNNLAWQLAIEPGTSMPCLVRAEELIDFALTQVPDVGGWMDTKATILYRQGRLDEAIDLEAAALSLTWADSPLATQLERFARKRQPGALVRGEMSAMPTLAIQDGQLNIDLKGGMPYGGKLLVRLSGDSGALGFVNIDLGANHLAIYKTPVPALARTAELAFADARGCDLCKPDSARLFFTAHDKEVDTYP